MRCIDTSCIYVFFVNIGNRLGLQAGLEAVEGVGGRVLPTVLEGLEGCGPTVEEVIEPEDGVAQVEAAVVIHIGGIGTGSGCRGLWLKQSCQQNCSNCLRRNEMHTTTSSVGRREFRGKTHAECVDG